MVWRLCKNVYHPEQRPSTEVSITAKSMKPLQDYFVHMDLWDLPGQEGIDLGNIVFEGVDLVVLVCSITDRRSRAHQPTHAVSHLCLLVATVALPPAHAPIT